MSTIVFFPGFADLPRRARARREDLAICPDSSFSLRDTLRRNQNDTFAVTLDTSLIF